MFEERFIPELWCVTWEYKCRISMSVNSETVFCITQCCRTNISRSFQISAKMCQKTVN